MSGDREFEPENALERSMLAALTDPARLDDFHAALAEGELIVPLYRDESGDVDPTRFIHTRYGGREGVIAFTSRRQLARAFPGGPCLEVTGRRLASGWDGKTSLLINPGGDLGLEVTSDVIAKWSEG